MNTTRSRKDSTILAPIDIADQPMGSFIFLTEGSGGTQAFSVDRLRVENEVVYAERYLTYTLQEVDSAKQHVSSHYTLVIAVPVRSPWTVIARDSVIFRTLEESVQKQKTDQDGEKALLLQVFGAPRPDPIGPVDPFEPPQKPPFGHYM